MVIVVIVVKISLRGLTFTKGELKISEEVRHPPRVNFATMQGPHIYNQPLYIATTSEPFMGFLRYPKIFKKNL